MAVRRAYFQSHTSEHVLDYVLEELDIVLIMSVNPGIWRTKSHYTRLKIEKIRTQIENNNYSTLIEVDGGVKIHNAHQFTTAGAHALVSGSGIFSSQDRSKCIQELRQVTENHLFSKM